MKNLVMGSAGGFDWVTLEPFITSFAKHVKRFHARTFEKLRERVVENRASLLYGHEFYRH